MAKSLEERVMIDLRVEEPQREISKKTESADKTVDQSGLDIKYQEELRRHLDRKDALKEGLNKAYALIYSNDCMKAMQSQIEEHPDFKSKLKPDRCVRSDQVTNARYRASPIPISVYD
jgi:hypothetical protein